VVSGPDNRRLALQDEKIHCRVNSTLTEVNHHLPMGLKIPLEDEKRRFAEPPPPSGNRRGVARGDGLPLAAISILVFCFAALLGDALLGGRGRAVILDRMAAALHGPSQPEIAVGSIRH
jgi:hypothetical protein